MYWGQNFGEGSIKDECGKYNYINIAFLTIFGNATTPALDLRHCNPTVGGCTYLGAEIKSCQTKGIKVFLSLGGPNGSYTLTSTEDAQQIADYIWNNFLGGTSSSRPFGDAVLDGIDFYIKHGTTQHWDELAQKLSNHGEQAGSVNTTFFMGLPASPNAAESGYLSPEVFNSQVQPAISRSSKYGGIMLWGVYYDPQYSSEVKPCAGVGKSCECKCAI
ncbi:hypothetical protein J5N97_021844 [Dioscorea zingiberensis]|uniref:GH18 domain-containing protein n=1 Tax=Dioscorea zingiberensis TaxID=325984 RepID=A0A9D5CAC1_9LILI|nr:hypothetical protein J5N97_021844 [Dioscorea zingiberensis]